MSKVSFFPNTMSLCLALSLATDSMALTFPFFSWSNKRNEMKATDKGSKFSIFKQGFKSSPKDENQFAQPTSVSFLDTGAISEDDYKQVVELRNDDAMERFIRRLLFAHGKAVNDESALQGFVPWFSGTKATQSLSQMKEQLFQKQWVIDASDLANDSSSVSFLTKRNAMNATDKESQVLTLQHDIKQHVKTHSDFPDKPSPAHKRSASKNLRASYHLESSSESKPKKTSAIKQVVDDCADTCYVGKHSSMAWEDHKCNWKHCTGCAACRSAQTLTVSQASSKAKSKSSSKSKSRGASAIQHDSDRCAMTCYSGRHSSMPWENHKCILKSCSGCQECRTSRTSKVSQASLEAKSESSLESKSNVQLELEVQELTPNEFRDTSAGPQAHGTELPVERAQEGAVPSPVEFLTMLHDAEETNGANSSRNDAIRILTAKNLAGRQEGLVADPPGSATVSVAATRPGSVETPSGKEDLLLGIQSLVDSQSQIVNDIASKIVELKANVGKAESSNRQSLDEATEIYQKKLLEQHMNTTRLLDMNKHLEDDIQALVSNNANLRQQAQELKKQSLALRVQITAAESNLTLAQEFVSKDLLNDSSDDFEFLRDLRMNESDVARTQAHTVAVDHFEGINSMALLQFENDTEPVELIHRVENTFSELSVQAEAGNLALQQSFEQSFSREAMLQESIMAKQRVLLDERQKQLALQSKLTDAVAHADKMRTYLSNRILHLRAYALRLSNQY